MGDKIVTVYWYLLNHYPQTDVPMAGEPAIRINCYDSGQNFIGEIRFYSKDSVQSSTVTSDGKFNFLMNYDIDKFQDIYTSIRNEKPVNVFTGFSFLIDV
jgi:hypothetical protein